MINKKILWMLKNKEFYADFEFVEKIAKKSCEKSYQRKSDRKIE